MKVLKFENMKILKVWQQLYKNSSNIINFKYIIHNFQSYLKQNWTCILKPFK